MDKLHILLKPESGDNNKKIINYLLENQRHINNKKMIIAPEVVTSSEINEFVKLGVTNLPSLLHSEYIIYGVNDIIKYIDRLCSPVNEKKKINIVDDDMREYMLDMVSKAGDDGDDGFETPVTDSDLRNNRFTNHNKKNTEPITEEDNASNYDNDDEDMNKFWNNKEETVM